MISSCSACSLQPYILHDVLIERDPDFPRQFRRRALRIGDLDYITLVTSPDDADHYARVPGERRDDAAADGRSGCLFLLFCSSRPRIHRNFIPNSVRGCRLPTIYCHATVLQPPVLPKSASATVARYPLSDYDVGFTGLNQ